MDRYYTEAQMIKSCQMEQDCRHYFEDKGIQLKLHGNCTECFCSNSCEECYDDQYCSPDYQVEELPLYIEVTGHNPINLSKNPGLSLRWPINVTHCKIQNYIDNHDAGTSDRCYVWHYSSITSWDQRTTQKETLIKDHIRVIKMDANFIEAYRANTFETKKLRQENFVCVPFDSEYVITPTQLLEEIAQFKIDSSPYLY